MVSTESPLPPLTIFFNIHYRRFFLNINVVDFDFNMGCIHINFLIFWIENGKYKHNLSLPSCPKIPKIYTIQYHRWQNTVNFCYCTTNHYFHRNLFCTTNHYFHRNLFNALTGRWYHWHHLKVTHWWADDAKCIIHSKIRQKLSNSPIVIVFCYIYAQKAVGSNTYAQVTGCPSVSAALGNWQFYVDSRRVWCYVCQCALSLVPCNFFTRLLLVV